MLRLTRAHEDYRARADAAIATLERVLAPCDDLVATLHTLAIAPLIEAGLVPVPSLPSPDLTPTARLADGYPVTVVDASTALSLAALPPDARPSVLAALRRARTHTIANTGHDGEPYFNRDRRLPSGVRYTEWTVSAPDAKRGRLRLVLAGDPQRPSAIYYSDHYDSFIWIGP